MHINLSYMYTHMCYTRTCTCRYQFKAKPLNPDIFLKGGLHGVPRKKTEVELTEAHTPVLATKERCRKRKAQEMTDANDDGDEEEQTATTFHAQPMPNFNKITVSIVHCIFFLVLSHLSWRRELPGDMEGVCWSYIMLLHTNPCNWSRHCWDTE